MFFASSHRSVFRIRRPFERRQSGRRRDARSLARVVARRRGAAEVGEPLADPGPESLIRAPVRLILPTTSMRRSANDRARRSPLPITWSAGRRRCGRVKREAVRSRRQRKRPDPIGARILADVECLFGAGVETDGERTAGVERAHARLRA